VAEPRRREIVDLLAAGAGLGVGELASRLALAQPQVSKHLRVLREVGLVEVRADGRRRVYELNAGGLGVIAEWVNRYERLWSERFEQLDEVLAEMNLEAQND
jgi:DNA-binding transcriptional ArsR family regulator